MTVKAFNPENVNAKVRNITKQLTAHESSREIIYIYISNLNTFKLTKYHVHSIRTELNAKFNVCVKMNQKSCPH